MATGTIVNNSAAAKLFAADSSATPQRATRDDAEDSSSFEQMLQSSRAKSRQNDDANSGDDESDEKKTAATKKKPRPAKPRAKAKSEQVPPTDDPTTDESAAVTATEPQKTPATDESKPASDVAKVVVSMDEATQVQTKRPHEVAEQATAAAVKSPVPVQDHATEDDQTDAPKKSAAIKPQQQAETNAVAGKTSPKQQVDESEESPPAEDAESSEPEHVEQASRDVVKTKQSRAATATDSAAKPAARIVSALAPADAAPSGQARNGETSQHQSQRSNPAISGVDASSDSNSDENEIFNLESLGGSDKPVGATKTDPLISDPADAAAALAATVPANQSHAPTAPMPIAIAQQPITPEARFAADNHQQIVTAVRGNLLPNGGTMSIRLDPPELGDLQLIVHMRDGVMSAAFQTSNDQATRVLSHSLSDLRSSLEASGVSVDRLHVEQAPKDSHARNDNPDSRQQSQSQTQDSPARRDQQRREILQRMWRKLNEGSDPLDLVA